MCPTAGVKYVGSERRKRTKEIIKLKANNEINYCDREKVVSLTYSLFRVVQCIEHTQK